MVIETPRNLVQFHRVHGRVKKKNFSQRSKFVQEQGQEKTKRYMEMKKELKSEVKIKEQLNRQRSINIRMRIKKKLKFKRNRTMGGSSYQFGKVEKMEKAIEN
jgi:hypothetical protein